MKPIDSWRLRIQSFGLTAPWFYPLWTSTLPSVSPACMDSSLIDCFHSDAIHSRHVRQLMAIEIPPTDNTVLNFQLTHSGRPRQTHDLIASGIAFGSHSEPNFTLSIFWYREREREALVSVTDWIVPGTEDTAPYLLFSSGLWVPFSLLLLLLHHLFASRFGYRLLPLIAAIHAWGSNTGEVNRERRDCRQFRSGQCVLRLRALLNRNRSLLRNDVTEKIFWRDGFLRSIMKMAYNWITETESWPGFKFWSIFFSLNLLVIFFSRSF